MGKVNQTNTKSNVLVTYLFPNDMDEFEKIDNDLLIQKEIANLMMSLKERGIVSRFVVADNEVISDKLKEN